MIWCLSGDKSLSKPMMTCKRCMWQMPACIIQLRVNHRTHHIFLNLSNVKQFSLILIYVKQQWKTISNDILLIYVKHPSQRPVLYEILSLLSRWENHLYWFSIMWGLRWRPQGIQHHYRPTASLLPYMPWGALIAYNPSQLHRSCTWGLKSLK